MKSTLDNTQLDTTFPNWTDDSECIKWQGKLEDITTRLATHDLQVNEVVLEIQETENELVSTRSAVILGESKESAVKEYETKLLALRDKHTQLVEEGQALRVAKQKAELMVKESEHNAKLQTADRLHGLHREFLVQLLLTLKSAVRINQELTQFEQHLASQKLSEFGPLRKKFLTKTAITGIVFPNGVRDWEEYIRPIMEE